MEEIPSPTIWTAIRRAMDQLEQGSVDSPRLTAEILMAHVLVLNRAGLLSRLHSPISAEAQRRFEALVAKRAAGEPLGDPGVVIRHVSLAPDALLSR